MITTCPLLCECRSIRLHHGCSPSAAAWRPYSDASRAAGVDAGTTRATDRSGSQDDQQGRAGDPLHGDRPVHHGRCRASGAVERTFQSGLYLIQRRSCQDRHAIRWLSLVWVTAARPWGSPVPPPGPVGPPGGSADLGCHGCLGPRPGAQLPGRGSVRLRGAHRPPRVAASGAVLSRGVGPDGGLGGAAVCVAARFSGRAGDSPLGAFSADRVVVRAAAPSHLHAGGGVEDAVYAAVGAAGGGRDTSRDTYSKACVDASRDTSHEASRPASLDTTRPDFRHHPERPCRGQ
jgi:hypothetical protein